jgi:hypothetical protein
MSFIYFGSGTKFPLLSNFAHVTIRVEMDHLSTVLKQRCPALVTALAAAPSNSLTFPSLEHLYQGSKARNVETLLRFTTEGDFGSWNPNLFDLTQIPKKVRDPSERAKAAEAKISYWKKKSAIGILAKIASNIKYAKVLNLGNGNMNYQVEILSPSNEQELWVSLLRIKYSQNKNALNVLRTTGSALLIEFDRGALKAKEANRSVHWGGLWDEQNKRVIGDNVMGKYLTIVREENKET